MYRICLLLVSVAVFAFDCLSGTFVGESTQAWIVPLLTLAGGVLGMVQRNAANQMEASNQFPNATVDPNIVQNLAVAEQMSQTGLPAEQYTLAREGLQRNLTGVLSAAERTRGYGVNLPSILRQSNQAQAALDAQNAAARTANQRVAMQARERLASENQRTWGWNQQQRYLQTASRLQALRSAGNQNIAGAFGLLAQYGLMGGSLPFGNGLFGNQSSAGLPVNGYLNNSLSTGFGMAPNYGPLA